ncbi:hypothetical protein HK405_008930, partial [Cladochytrium tenue]
MRVNYLRKSVFLAAACFGSLVRCDADDNGISSTLRSTTSAAPSTSTFATTTSVSAVSSTSANSTSADSYCYGSNFCVYATLDVESDVVTFSVQSTLSGWVGFGIGSYYMSGATIYLAYTNTTGGVTLSQRSTSGHTSPTYSSTQALVLVGTALSTGATSLQGATLAFTFNRTISPTGAASISTSGPTRCIWAASDNAPSNPDSASVSLVEHKVKGSFSLDLSITTDGSASNQSSSDDGGPSSPIDPDVGVLVHGSLMFVAWGVCPPAAIFIARYLKPQLGHNWYRLHMGLATGGTLLLTGLGLLFVELTLGPGDVRLLGSDGEPHRPLGVALALAMLPAQVVLGVLANWLFSPARTGVPWWDQLH